MFHASRPGHAGPTIGLAVAAALLAPAATAAGVRSASPAAAPASPNYAKASNWLARPAHPTRNVDVFYLYPTSYFKTSPSQPVISTINNPAMVAGAKNAFAGQATAFDTVANVYAPYYRQADAVTVLTSPLATQNRIIGGTPSHDAIAAFAYYISHINHGRPFILAGHSQGSNVLLFLLSRYLRNHPAVYRRMVAAYVIGYGVTRSYLSRNRQLRFASRRRRHRRDHLVEHRGAGPDDQEPGGEPRVHRDQPDHVDTVAALGARREATAARSCPTRPGSSPRSLTTPMPGSTRTAARSSAARAASPSTHRASRAVSPAGSSTPTTTRSTTSTSGRTRAIGSGDT